MQDSCNILQHIEPQEENEAMLKEEECGVDRKGY